MFNFYTNSSITIVKVIVGIKVTFSNKVQNLAFVRSRRSIIPGENLLLGFRGFLQPRQCHIDEWEC